MSLCDIQKLMEQRYKDALRHIYQQKLNPSSVERDYPNSLFASACGYRFKVKSKSQSDVSSTKPISEVTEKTIILDSLHQFGKEQLENKNKESLRVEGGEIVAKKSSKDTDNTFEISPVSVDSLVLDEIAQVRLSTKVNQGVKVIFVSDCFLENLDEQKSEVDLEFFTLFEGNTAIMFSNMVKAMKLSSNDFCLSAVKSNSQSLDNDYLISLLNEIYNLRPKLIVPMGITASECLLGLNKRLKDIHGKFYTIEINDFTTQVMPLFSPNLLNSAVNMKKIAWEDMQKAMHFLDS